jgi:hypothetical protein
LSAQIASHGDNHHCREPGRGEPSRDRPRKPVAQDLPVAGHWSEFLDIARLVIVIDAGPSEKRKTRILGGRKSLFG